MWAQILNALLGLILMISPAIFSFTTTESDVNHILGPLAISFAVISFWQVNRNARVFNIGIGCLLIIAVFIFGFTRIPFWIDLFSGVLLVIFSFVKGKITQKFGGGWRSLL